jgi:hypothetical protein
MTTRKRMPMKFSAATRKLKGIKNEESDNFKSSDGYVHGLFLGRDFFNTGFFRRLAP